MEIARHWRIKQQRYQMEGQVCPVCGACCFPPRPVCPQCVPEQFFMQERTRLQVEAPALFTQVEAKLPALT